ncbi:MAG: serine/threonine protein kinase [Planctomycetota bacterium]
MSTGGFETLLGKLVVSAGLATDEEVQLCAGLLAESAGKLAGDSAGPDDSTGPGDSAGDSRGDSIAASRTLADLLVENHFATHRQLRRIKQDFEAKKSSQRIPGYRILKKLGAGAMATVFKAKQLSLDRHVAIKVLPRKFSDNEKFIQRFYKEGRAAAKLNHPNIVGAYDVGKAGDHHYFVMEYVDGQTVYDRIVADKQVDESEAVEIVKQVARALQHAHARGFVHRDIKPKNIMLSRDGTVKLADLGLARAMSDKDAAKAEAGRAYGTPYYISPEQIRGEIKIGPAADLYGLGATFYHMVTGKVPFEGKNPSQVMHRHLKEDLKPPDHLNQRLSAGCAQVIEMMMAKSASDRYHNSADLLEDLDLVSKGESPHFARSTLDMSSIAPSLTGPAATATAVAPATTGPPANSTLLVVLTAVMAGSLIVNLVLLGLLMAR